MKKKLNIHSGMSKKLRFKIIDEYLANYKNSDYLALNIIY